MWYFLILVSVFASDVDSVSSNNENEPWKNPYLPNTVEPISYDIYFSPHLSNSRTDYYGNVSITVNVLNRTNIFIVHSKGLKVTDVMFFDHNDVRLRIANQYYYVKNDYYVVQTEEFLHGRYKLFYGMQGNMTWVKGSEFNRSGIYIIPFDKENEHTRWLAVTDLRPNYARCVFPNFDEPRFKATYKIGVQHWNTYTTLSNMPVENYVPTGGSYHFSVFKESSMMSSYQVSFAITDFSFRNKTVDGKLFRSWAQPDALEMAGRCLDVIANIQNHLQQELNMSYSLEKLDQIAVPRDVLTDQLENLGLVTYKDSAILYDATTGGASARFEALRVITAAQARYYFGNLVTCRFWEHVWLDEGLATFYEVFALMDFEYKEYFFGWKVEDAMWMDAISLLRPLILPSNASEATIPNVEIQRRIKGAAILRMVENFVGHDTFKSGIRAYLRQNANGTVVTDNLWAAIQQEITSGLDVKKIMTNWVEKSGFPLITVHLLPGNMINATQKQFLHDPLVPPGETYKWYVPLTFRTKDGPHQLTWMNKTDAVFEIPELSSDGWIQFNCDEAGYYRVKYSEDLRNMLVRQLIADHTLFSELSRSRLLSDALALANAEEIGYDVFLNLTRYASKETDLTPWFHIHKGLHELLGFFNTSIYCCYQNYISNLTNDLINRLQVDNGGSYIERELRPLIVSLSCTAGHEGCIENSTRAFRAWIENNETAGVRDVSCPGIAGALQESLWNATFEKYKRTTTGFERADLLLALSCTGNATLLERLLDCSLDPTIVPHDQIHTVVYNVATNPLSEDVVWMWLKNKYAEIERTNGSEFAELLIPMATSFFRTQEQYQEVLDFYTVHPNVTETAKSVTKFYIEKNIRWMERNFDTVKNWLEQYA